MRNRMVIKHEVFKQIRGALVQGEVYFISGNHTITVPSVNTKFVIHEVTTKYEHSVYGQGYFAPGEIAYDVLNVNFPELSKVGWRGKGTFKLLEWTWPRYLARPFVAQESVYIDLKAAYWQIYRWLSLDTHWPRGIGNLNLWHVAEKLEKYKKARNSVIGICASKSVLAYKGKRPIKIPTNAKFLSPGLWATVQAILHEIAISAVKCGALYIATDCYIFPPGSNVVAFEMFLRRYGLNYRIEVQEVHVKGWTAYRRGTKQTHLYKYWNAGNPVRNVYQPHYESETAFLDWWHNTVKERVDRWLILTEK